MYEYLCIVIYCQASFFRDSSREGGLGRVVNHPYENDVSNNRSQDLFLTPPMGGDYPS